VTEPSEPQGDKERHRFEFRLGEVFDVQDRMARYVIRLSQALGDLRIAGSYAIRPEQPIYERIYFVRLTAAHLHEVAILFKPPDEAIPGIEDFIQAVVEPSDAEGARALRDSHREVRRALDRPVKKVPGKPALASELSRIRNEFLHYANKKEYEPPLCRAMELAASIETAYVIRERSMRAEYADEINNKLLHPWKLDDDAWLCAVKALHGSITDLIAPITDFLHQAEASFLASTGAVKRVDL
jgi:hypothetical protein